MWWIKKADQGSYESLMRQYGDGPHILREEGDYLFVEFCAAALQVWAQAGFWFGGSPNFLSGIYQKCLTFVKTML